MKKTLYFLIFSFILIACDEKNDHNNLQNETVIVDNNLYKETATNNYTITDVQLEGHLLTINISSGGCSANSWKAILVDANEILESDPIHRNIKLSLENNEACLAVFGKQFTFDITILKEEFYEVIFNLKGWNHQIKYN